MSVLVLPMWATAVAGWAWFVAWHWITGGLRK